jgi:hypothetical protein
MILSFWNADYRPEITGFVGKAIEKILSRLDGEFEFMTTGKRPRDLENLSLI